MAVVARANVVPELADLVVARMDRVQTVVRSDRAHMVEQPMAPEHVNRVPVDRAVEIDAVRAEERAADCAADELV
jgi:hypothetical protein